MFTVTEVDDPEHGPSVRIVWNDATTQTIHCGAEMAPIVREAIEGAYREGREVGYYGIVGTGEEPLPAEESSGRVAYATIKPGTCWQEQHTYPDGSHDVGCRWPEYNHKGADTGYNNVPWSKFGDSDQPAQTDVVTVLAHGLSAAQCSWILSTRDGGGAWSAKRARHLAAGGTVENYPGDA